MENNTNMSLGLEYSYVLTNTSTVTAMSSDEVLENYNLTFAKEVFPVIVFLFTVMGFGTVGNILVCVVYMCNKRKSVNGRFILSLASLDLINCLLCIPAEIVDLRYKATFGEFVYICKASKTLLAFTSVASCSVLVAIAIDRYKSICKPFKHQTALPMARSAIVTCCVLAMCFSAPTWFINGKKMFPVVNGTSGADCAISSELVHGIIPTIYNTIFFILFVTGAVILIVFYTLIWKRLKIQDRFRRAIGRGLSFLRNSKKTRKRLAKDKRMETMETDTRPYGSTLKVDHESLNVSPSSPQSQLSPVLVSSTTSSATSTSTQSQLLLPQSENRQSETETTLQKPKAADKSKTPPRVNKTTFVMFLVTVLFIVSFLPYLVLTTARAINRNTFKGSYGMDLALYNLFLRFHFLNSAFNPVVYSFCGQQFRKDLKMLLKNPYCRA